jgi:hypothetical protein
MEVWIKFAMVCDLSTTAEVEQTLNGDSMCIIPEEL